MSRHEIEVYEGDSGRRGTSHWWRCATCGDEGGPFDLWEFAHDSAISHSIRADEPENFGSDKEDGRD